MITITAATGNIGRRLAEILLTEGKAVRVIGRSEERLQPLVDQGAEALAGDLGDVEFVTRAFEGSDSVFALIPPNYGSENVRALQNEIGEVLATAIQNANVKYVVNLSSLGAHLSEGTGPVLGLHDQEQRLNKIEGLNVVHLRPTYFMENMYPNIAVIKGQGINGTPLRADLQFPMIATRDISPVAAQYLGNVNFSGQNVHELLGPRDVSMAEFTQAIGKAIGKPDLPYVRFPYEDAEKAMIGMGISPDMARSLTELNKAINEENGITSRPRSPETNTPTSIEEFASFFAQAYNAS
ncbi:MAG: NmrA family NAD(P)-binding protein [bacterium]|nr:NmrA family NAD(P)-binding protein [bacterium]